jgi:hypothetical protein
MADLTISLVGFANASMIIMTGDFGPLPAMEVTLALARLEGEAGIRR